MSGVPANVDLPPHVSGTTWLGWAVAWLDDAGDPLDLTGADARMRWVDRVGATVFDWHLSDIEKPGLRLADDPTTGILHVDGPGVLSTDPGILRWDLKVWDAVTSEVFVDLAGSLEILEGVTP